MPIASAPTRSCAPSGARALGIATHTPLLFTAGRLVRKKGFEYLIDALAAAAQGPERSGGHCRRWRSRRASSAQRVEDARIGYRVRFLGNLSQDEIAGWLATADMIAVPSVRDDSGNVDGLPNIVLETMASGTPIITTPAGGIASVVEHRRSGPHRSRA